MVKFIVPFMMSSDTVDEINEERSHLNEEKNAHSKPHSEPLSKSHRHRSIGGGKLLIYVCLGVLLVTVLSIFGVVYLTKWSIPTEVTISNITDRSVTVSWVTDVPTKGCVLYGTTEGFGPSIFDRIGKETSLDDRDVNSAILEAAARENASVSLVEGSEVDYEQIAEDVYIRDAGEYFVHHVTISNLDPEQTYYFKVGNGYRFAFPDSEKSFTTYASSDALLLPDPAYGLISRPDGSMSHQVSVEDGLVYVTVMTEDESVQSDLLSAVLSENGSWYVDLSSARNEDGSTFWGEFSNGELNRMKERVEVVAGEYGMVTKDIPFDADAPADRIMVVSDEIEAALGEDVLSGSSEFCVDALTDGSPCYFSYAQTDPYLIDDNCEYVCTGKGHCSGDGVCMNEWYTGSHCTKVDPTCGTVCEGGESCYEGQVCKNDGDPRCCLTECIWVGQEADLASLELEARSIGDGGDSLLAQIEAQNEVLGVLDELVTPVQATDNCCDDTGWLSGRACSDSASPTYTDGYNACQARECDLCSSGATAGTLGQLCDINRQCEQANCDEGLLCVGGHCALESSPECSDTVGGDENTEINTATGACADPQVTHDQQQTCNNAIAAGQVVTCGSGGTGVCKGVCPWGRVEGIGECPGTDAIKCCVPVEGATSTRSTCGCESFHDGLYFDCHMPEGDLAAISEVCQAKASAEGVEYQATCVSGEVQAMIVDTDVNENSVVAGVSSSVLGESTQSGSVKCQVKPCGTTWACGNDCWKPKICCLYNNQEYLVSTYKWVESVVAANGDLSCPDGGTKKTGITSESECKAPSTSKTCCCNENYRGTCTWITGACSASSGYEFPANSSKGQSCDRNTDTSCCCDPQHPEYCISVDGVCSGQSVYTSPADSTAKCDFCANPVNEGKECGKHKNCKKGKCVLGNPIDGECSITMDHLCPDSCTDGCDCPGDRVDENPLDGVSGDDVVPAGKRCAIRVEGRGDVDSCDFRGDPEGSSWVNIGKPCGNEPGKYCGTAFLGQGMCKRMSCEDAAVLRGENPDDACAGITEANWFNNFLMSVRSFFGFSTLVTETRADSTPEVDGDIILIPEMGVYSLSIGGEMTVTGIEIGSEDDIGTFVYIERNNVDGYQIDEDEVVDVASYELSLSKDSALSTYSIREGFNFVSFPMVMDGVSGYNTATTMLDYLNSTYDDVFLSIASFESGRWIIVENREGQNYGADDFQIIPGRGYLLKARDDVEIRISGKDLIDPVPVSMIEGWNLIGIHGTSESYTASSLIDSIDETEGLNADNVSKWDTSISRYSGLQKEDDSGGNSNEYGFDFPIETKLGYFVRIAEGSGTWIPGE